MNKCAVQCNKSLQCGQCIDAVMLFVFPAVSNTNTNSRSFVFFLFLFFVLFLKRYFSHRTTKIWTHCVGTWCYYWISDGGQQTLNMILRYEHAWIVYIQFRACVWLFVVHLFASLLLFGGKIIIFMIVCNIISSNADCPQIWMKMLIHLIKLLFYRMKSFDHYGIFRENLEYVVCIFCHSWSTENHCFSKPDKNVRFALKLDIHLKK